MHSLSTTWQGGQRRLLALLSVGLLCAATAVLVPSTTASAATSADGRIAFYGYQDGDADIYTINPDGTGETNLTNEDPGAETLADADPSWSPDGTRIAYTVYTVRSGLVNDIYVMNSDGSDAVNRTQNTGSGQAGTTGDRAPAWSPDGSKIAFWTDRDVTEMCSNGCDREIYWMNPDGTGQQNLTSAPGADDYDPTFSPDGSQIAFTSNRSGDYALYSLDVSTVPQPAISGSNAAPMATDTGSVADRATVSLITSTYAQGADWQPLPRPRALACTLVGSAGPDVLYGNASADVLCGRAGGDSLRGHGGSDILRGNRGGDNLLAGRGSDRLFGGSGADTLESDDGIGGNDRVDGGPGHDICLIDIGDVTRGCEKIRGV